MSEPKRILYCHCAFANVVPKAVKEEVLHRLTESGRAFDAVADLCELSARKDPCLQQLAAGGPVQIAACYPRAVKWLFSAGGAPLPDGVAEVHNMRTETADAIIGGIIGERSGEDKA
jgi:hypothetical protein